MWEGAETAPTVGVGRRAIRSAARRTARTSSPQRSHRSCRRRWASATAPRPSLRVAFLRSDGAAHRRLRRLGLARARHRRGGDDRVARRHPVLFGVARPALGVARVRGGALGVRLPAGLLLLRRRPPRLPVQRRALLRGARVRRAVVGDGVLPVDGVPDGVRRRLLLARAAGEAQPRARAADDRRLRARLLRLPIGGVRRRRGDGRADGRRRRRRLGRLVRLLHRRVVVPRAARRAVRAAVGVHARHVRRDARHVAPAHGAHRAVGGGTPRAILPRNSAQFSEGRSASPARCSTRQR